MEQLTLFQVPLLDKKDPSFAGRPRLKTPVRNQMEFKISSLNDLIPEDHIVRLVWGYVENLDMNSVFKTIQSVEGGAGRPATDPRILLALWLYATLEGIISARVIADYCEEHIAYQWLCGGVKINHHTLSDFSTKHSESFDEFLTQSVAILIKQGCVDLEEVSQDGMRVRANAGKSSFKGEEGLSTCYNKAKQYLEDLRKELEQDPSNNRTKKRAASLRAAEERKEKIEQALKELKKLQEEKKENAKKNGKEAKQKMLKEPKVSMTDPEARKIKMACGGFSAAFNVQFATTTKGLAIVGVDVNNRGNDTGLIVSMIRKVHEKFGIIPTRWLVDTGYASYVEIDQAVGLGCKIYMPPKISGRTEKNYYERQKGDSEAIAEWRARMGTEEGKSIYKRRGQTAEWSNAQARNKGLQQFIIRGLKKARTVAYRFALVHNMQRYFSFRAS